jgi:hypothetical protein
MSDLLQQVVFFMSIILSISRLSDKKNRRDFYSSTCLK